MLLVDLSRHKGSHLAQYEISLIVEACWSKWLNDLNEMI